MRNLFLLRLFVDSYFDFAIGLETVDIKSLTCQLKWSLMYTVYNRL